MKQSCTSTFRRSAAIGAAVAVVTASSAFGIGATAAMADEGSSSTAPTTSVTTGATSSTDVSSAGAVSAPAAPPADQAPTTAPVATPTTTPSTATPATPATTAPTAEAEDTATTAPTAEAEDAGTDGATGTAGAATPAAGPAAEDGSDLAFTEPSTKDAPLALTATAGTPFSHTFHTTGGNGTVGYAIQDAPSEDWTVNVETGVLSGTPKVAGTFDFEVVALSGSTQITEYVEVTVSPGAPVGVTFAVATPDHSGLWQVDADGTIWEQAAGEGRVRIVTSIPVADGSSLVLAGLAVDAWGNRTTPGGDDVYPRSTATSSVASDRAVWNDRDSSNTVTFAGAGTRTVTVAEGGVATSFTAVVPSASFGFTEESSDSAPVRVAATAGKAFSHPFAVTGAPDPHAVRYELRGIDGQALDDSFARNDLDVAIDPDSGVLSGTGTAATSFRFQVVAVSGGQESVAHVEVAVAPAAVDRIVIGVLSADHTGIDADDRESWGVDGDTITHYAPGSAPRTVDAIPARQGQRMQIRALPVDAYGNPVADHTDLRITSDVQSDRIAYDADAAATWVTFEHASPHTVTVAYDDVASTIRFAVSPATTGTVAHTTPGAASGALAYTGTDTSGPLAWALGLLAAGAALLVHRLRRRRV